MDLDINSSQLSLRSLSYHQTIMNNTTTNNNHISSSSPRIHQSYFCRLKKTLTKNFCCHQTRLSSSCLKCFRYFIPTKHKCECQIIIFLLFSLEYIRASR